MNQLAKNILWILIVVIIVGIGYVLLQAPSDEREEGDDILSGEPITIGFIGPLTGELANLGENARAAVEIAVEEVNEAGGIDGRPLEVIYEDGKCEGKDASNAANKLININGVPVILGGLCSGETSAFAPTAEETQTVAVSYCSSAPAISQAGDYIFRNYPSDLNQGVFAANYIFNELGKKNVAVLYVNNAWGSGLKDVFSKTFQQLGGEVLLEEAHEQTSKDLRTQLTKVKAANPDLIYFLGYTEASVPGLKQAQELQINVPIFGGDAWDDPKLFEQAGSAGEGVMYSVVYAAPNEEFTRKMSEKTGSSEVTLCSPQAYDAVKIISQIMSEVGTDPTDIKNALYEVHYEGGISSDTISFDENGDPVGSNYIIKVVKDGKATEFTGAMEGNGEVMEK